MKTLAVIAVLGVSLISPTVAASAPSYGAQTMQEYKLMVEWCRQAVSDSKALNIPLTGDLKKQCDV